MSMSDKRAESYYALGQALFKEGKLDEALSCFCQAIEVDENFVPAYTQAAHIFAVQGMKAKAASYDKQALVLTSMPRIKECRLPDDIESALRSVPAFRTTADPNALPIIVLYRDLQLYTRSADFPLYCVAQAKKSNPLSQIVLIGDSTNHSELATHAYVLDYYKGAEEFAGIYKHFAREVRFDYLLFCFQRWFIVRDFMKAHGIEQCLHIDPDVMLFTDVTKFFRQSEDCDLMLSADPEFGMCGHYLFVSNLAALEKFCEFLMDMSGYSPADESDARVDDMTAFAAFHQQRVVNIHNLSAVVGDSVWDPDVNCSHGFELDRELKNIFWDNDQAFCKQLGTGKTIRFHALHFCNTAKKYMRNAFLQRPLWNER